MPRKGNEDSQGRVHLTVRIQPALLARLTEAARKRELGRTLIVNRAIERYLDELDRLDKIRGVR